MSYDFQYFNIILFIEIHTFILFISFQTVHTPKQCENEGIWR